MKRNDIITDIGERLTDAIYELNDSFEWDYCEESGSRSHSCTACIKYEYGGKEYDVQVWASWPHIGDSSLEVEISGGKGKAGRWKYYDSLEQAVLEYLNANLSMNDLLSNLLEQLQDCYEDEWESHGFSSAADYYSWRYGAPL